MAAASKASKEDLALAVPELTRVAVELSACIWDSMLIGGITFKSGLPEVWLQVRKAGPTVLCIVMFPSKSK